ncbi:MAG TPA: PaaI family thioesterase [Prolixibacteraceae bacterium]
MIRKILNPYLKSERKDYNCFGCSPNNDKGLQLKFELHGDEVVAVWNPQRWAEGYRNVLHGGIQAALLDEVCSWVVQSLCKTSGVTTSMEISYRKPVLISDGDITLRGRLTEQNSRMAFVDGKLFSNDGTVCAIAKCKFFLFPIEKAKSDFEYPGGEAFFEE